VGDLTAPVVENVAPAPGTPLASLASVSFDVVEAVGLRRVIVAARFSDGAYEVVHDGDAFGARYAGISSRVQAGDRTTYVIRRRRGWGSAPTLKVFPIDTSGNEG
jgi:hypothetical protein